MKCKYCQTELEEGVTLCPACGAEQEQSVEETVAEAPAEETAPQIKEGVKATPGKITLAIVAGVVVLGLLIGIVLSGIDGDLFQGEAIAPSEVPTAAVEETEAAEPATEGTIPPDGNPEDVTCKGSYTVSDAEIEASRDTVVAVIGDKELTLGQLQVYYWECVYSFDSQWGTNAAMLGLDLSYPLDTQLCESGDISMTWQQYFLDYALNSWHQHQSMALESAENGYVLDEVYQAELDALDQQLAEMAEYYGFADTEELMRDYIGPGCTTEDYGTYLATYYQGLGYLEHLGSNMEVTYEDVDAFYLENEGSYGESGITKDAGKVVDVRHILLMPENGTTGSDGYPEYTDEDWAACEAEAQKIYDEWMAGDKSEESFAEFAKQYSQDGNASVGGIYEDVTQGYMVESFDAWCFDESRQPGDHGLVKTQYGYHIMFFVDSEDLWYAAAEADLISEKLSAAIPAAMEKFPMTVDYSAIKLGLVEFVSG